MIRAADLFAGLGGFTTGAEQSGRVRVELAANHWPEAVEWHHRNHPSAPRPLCQDIQQMDMRALGDLSSGLLLASPACQGHSQCGQPAEAGTGGSHAPSVQRMRTKHDADRQTMWAVLAACDTARPRVLLLENVPDLLRWDLFGAWCGVLEAMGYAVRSHVLDARTFGAAQHRERCIVTASQVGPIKLEPGGLEPATIADILDPDDHPDNRWTALDDKPARMRERIVKAQDHAGRRCVWNNVSESLGRPLDAQLPTLTTQAGTQLYLLDGDRGRILNPRELARGQGFPEDYQLPRNRKLASKLLGNAIHVGKARGVVAQTLAAAF